MGFLPLGYEDGHLSLSSAKVMNGWSYTSTLPYMPSLYGQEQLLLFYTVLCQRLGRMQTSKEMSYNLTSFSYFNGIKL
jgi:hypothetical protein